MRTKKDFDYQNDYNRQNYDRIGLMLPKGMAELWKAEAKRRNLSLNAYVIKAVNFYETHSASQPNQSLAECGASLSAESEDKRRDL